MLRIFEPKGVEVPGDVRYYQGDDVEEDERRRGGHVTRMGEMRSAYLLLVGKPEGKRPLGRPMYRWEDSTALA